MYGETLCTLYYVNIIDMFSIFQHALGLELWSMTDHIIFDNFLVTDDKEVHSSWVAQTWEKKSTAETYSSGGVRLSSLCLLFSFNRPYLESAIFETCMISIFILVSFERK